MIQKRKTYKLPLHIQDMVSTIVYGIFALASQVAKPELEKRFEFVWGHQALLCPLSVGKRLLCYFWIAVSDNRLFQADEPVTVKVLEGLVYGLHAVLGTCLHDIPHLGSPSLSDKVPDSVGG